MIYKETKNENLFNLQAVYFGTESKINIIPLLFINNNHFEILYHQDFINQLEKINLNQKELKDKINDMKNNNTKNNI